MQPRDTHQKTTRRVWGNTPAGDAAPAAPVSRQARELGRKLKELKDSLYNSDVQRDAGQDDIHYLNRFQDRLQGLGFGLAFAYAQPPNEVVAARLTELRAALADYLAKFNELVRTDVAVFNKTAQEHGAPVLVAGGAVGVEGVAGPGPAAWRPPVWSARSRGQRSE